MFAFAFFVLFSVANSENLGSESNVATIDCNHVNMAIAGLNGPPCRGSPLESLSILYL